MILVEVVLVFDLSQIKQEHLPLLLFFISCISGSVFRRRTSFLFMEQSTEV